MKAVAARQIFILFLAVVGAWLLNHTANPKTSLNENKNPFVTETFPWETVCAGIKCRGCVFTCFLPGGFTGHCGQRMNQGGRAVIRVSAGTGNEF